MPNIRRPSRHIKSALIRAQRFVFLTPERLQPLHSLRQPGQHHNARVHERLAFLPVLSELRASIDSQLQEKPNHG